MWGPENSGHHSQALECRGRHPKRFPPPRGGKEGRNLLTVVSSNGVATGDHATISVPLSPHPKSPEAPEDPNHYPPHPKEENCVRRPTRSRTHPQFQSSTKVFACILHTPDIRVKNKRLTGSAPMPITLSCNIEPQLAKDVARIEQW